MTTSNWTIDSNNVKSFLKGTSENQTTDATKTVDSNLNFGGGHVYLLVWFPENRTVDEQNESRKEKEIEQRRSIYQGPEERNRTFSFLSLSLGFCGRDRILRESSSLGEKRPLLIFAVRFISVVGLSSRQTILEKLSWTETRRWFRSIRWN